MLVPKARAGLVTAALAVLACAALPAVAAAKPDPRGNDLGIQVVRFAEGTSPAAMRAAVASAGAEVVTDLSAIDALAVVPTGSGFKTKIEGQKGVRGAWLDHVNRTNAFQPDPLHDLNAFNGEDAPGVLQWEDDRDGVRQAWNTTKGAGIKVAVIDSGIDPTHPELRDNVLFTDNTIPCSRLTAIFGGGTGTLHDCSKSDTDGHGKGTTVIASAGNEHIRNLRRTVTLTGVSGTRTIAGAGVVSTSRNEGINAFPGDAAVEKYVNDYRGMLEMPAGVPGVLMVSSSSNAIPDPAGNVVPAYAPGAGVVGTQDNLAYYSSYGERVDISAPGGGRKYGVPKFDTRPGTDVLYGGWGQLGATVKTGDICRTIGSPADFACFEYDGATFGWFQGTSMSSPQVSGVAALVLAAKPGLREHPDLLAAQLKGTARKGIVNHTGKSSASTGAVWDGTSCGTGYCHVTFTTSPTDANAISSAQAYGAGMVDAAAAVK